ncbi:MAG: DUF4988 domain-containing protein, partial [Bacteroidales bacterium]|nr:DUF4988 domain-containing protein [Bacteroidales bacterium]
MKNKIFWAVAATVLFLCGCVKDQELYDKVDDLGNRVSALEETVKELKPVNNPGLVTYRLWSIHICEPTSQRRRG